MKRISINKFKYKEFYNLINYTDCYCFIDLNTNKFQIVSKQHFERNKLGIYCFKNKINVYSIKNVDFTTIGQREHGFVDIQFVELNIESYTFEDFKYPTIVYLKVKGSYIPFTCFYDSDVEIFKLTAVKSAIECMYEENNINKDSYFQIKKLLNENNDKLYLEINKYNFFEFMNNGKGFKRH